MAKNKRLKILLRPEIDDLYSPPQYTIEQQRYFFSLNDQELVVAKSIRKREHRCYFVAMLGYFKSKPIILNPSFRSIESDLSFIAKDTFRPKSGIPPKCIKVGCNPRHPWPVALVNI